MPVSSMPADYLANAGVWKRSRDVLSGEDVVKAAGEEYLPRLDAQSDEEFRAYVKRASFFNATSRTAEGYLGMIFRRELLVKSAGIPDGLLADVDLAATPLNGYAKRVVNEVVAVGRCGTLVDWNDAPTHDEQWMAVPGARLLFNTKRVAESAEAMQLRMVSEDGILATLAKVCSEGLRAALQWVSWWHSADLDTPDKASGVEVRLNVDFDARGIPAAASVGRGRTDAAAG